MRKFLLLFLMSIVLLGCSQNAYDDYRDDYIEEQGITNIKEIMVYEDKPYIKGVIFKGTVDGTEENLYYFEGVSGDGEGIYANGAYTGSLLHTAEGLTYDIHKGEDYGYDKSYFVGIAYMKMESVYYKGESIEFQTVDVNLNNEEISLTVWLMPYNNGEDMDISDFEYK